MARKKVYRVIEEKVNNLDLSDFSGTIKEIKDQLWYYEQMAMDEGYREIFIKSEKERLDRLKKDKAKKAKESLREQVQWEKDIAEYERLQRKFEGRL